MEPHELPLSFQSTVTGDTSPDTLAARPLSLDGFRLVRIVGTGGMGEVWEAEQEWPLRRTVAIKFVKWGMVTREFIQRFESERQALASMDHPNVTRVFEAGATREERPYFVMEFVHGLRITDYCNENRLTVGDRLRLFLSVCSGIQHAHQKGVIHRDIKPSNVLVLEQDGRPVAKVIDFGVAKAASPTPSNDTTVTVAGRLVGTPEYMSPEQFDGSDIDTRADVYSLGVLLYELLADVSPFATSGGQHDGLDRIRRRVCEEDPVSPSTRVARMQGADDISPARRTTKPALVRQIRGDLDAIVSKAIEKDRRRRYDTVEALSQDIQRHLTGEPVLAQPPSATYRLGKFVRRHRVGVAAAALVCASLVAGLAATLWQARVANVQRARAERRFLDVRRLANSLVFDIHDAIASLPGSVAARKMIVTKALEYLDSLSREASSDTALRHEVADAYEKVGDVQGGAGMSHLGDPAGALESYRKAEAIRRIRDNASAGDDRADARLLGIELKIGDALVRAAQLDRAAVQYDTVLKEWEQRAQASPQDVDAVRGLMTAHGRLCTLRRQLDDIKGAQDSCRKAVALLDAFAARQPDDAGILKLQATAYVGLGNALQAGGVEKEAVEWLTRGVERLRSLARRFPADGDVPQRLAASTLYLGQYLEANGALGAAATTYSEAVEVMDPIAAADPNSVQSQLMFSAILGKQAEALSRLGRESEALAAGARSLRISGTLARRPSADATVLNEHAWRLVSILPRRLRQPGEAVEFARRALAGSNNTNPAVFHTLAVALYQSADRDGAIGTMEKGLSLLSSTGGPGGAIRQRLAADLARMRKGEPVP